MDAIAFIHLMRLPVKEPARLKAALAHLESMIALSHESWKFIVTETDDDHEWVPNTKQHRSCPTGPSPWRWSRAGWNSSMKPRRS